MRLVFIHGRSQEGKDPAALQQAWEEALQRGLKAAGLTWPSGVKIAFPFYGDKLAEMVRALEAPLVVDVFMRGASPDSREASFRGELLAEMAAAAGISDAAIQENYAGEPHERGPLNWEWVQSILKAFDATPLGATFVDAFTRDVYVYLNYRVVQDAIDAVAGSELSQGPCVVVGHSLGTVVGYNALSRRPPTVQVCKYVTVGSPLGLNSIKRRLQSPLAMPNGLVDWYNAMDERDVVALYPLDGAHFPITPAVKNNTAVRNHTENRHGIDGYLDDPRVAREIYEAIVN